MNKLTAVLLIPFLIVFFILLLWTQNWRSNEIDRLARVEYEQFTRGVHEPLYLSQKSLLRSKDNMSRLINTIGELVSQHPNHRDLLVDVKGAWQKALTKVVDTYDSNDRKIRRAWILKSNLNKKDVLDKFYKEAVLLDKNNRSIDKNYQDEIRYVADLIEKDLRKSIRLISQHASENDNFSAKNIGSFSTDNQVVLINYLQKRDAGLADKIQSLIENQRVATQKELIIDQQLKQHPDLNRPLSEVMESWKKLQGIQGESLRKLFYATESEFLAKKLGVVKQSSALKVMKQQLNVRIPAIAGKMNQQRELLENSYNFFRN